jgi:large subunit ribosomal protein L18
MAETRGLFERRRWRIRRRLVAAAKDRPRLSVFRSNKHIYAQVIDDRAGRTLAAASTLDAALKGSGGSGSDTDAAQQVGKLVAERALAAGVSTVIFDRGGYRYHGRVKALADAAREAGLGF